MVALPNPPILRVSFQGAIENSAGTSHALKTISVSLAPDADFGSCGSFDGTSSKITVDALACPQTFTVMAWVKRHTDLIAGDVTLFEFGDNTPLISLNDGKPRFTVSVPEQPGISKIAQTQQIPAKWTHIALAYTQGVVCLYVDGKQCLAWGGYTFTPGTGLGIGHNQGDKFFRGELAEVHLYDQFLSSGTIQWLRIQTHPKLAAEKAAADAAAAAAKAAADAAAAAKAVVHNLVLPGFNPDYSLTTASTSFYKTHGDDYDFLVFISPHSRSAYYTPVRREECAGLGQTYANGNAPVRNGEVYGSAARLKGAIWLPLDMRDGWSPPSYIHELMHHWGVSLKSSWDGFIKGLGSHWGFASTSGSLGGFDLQTLETEAGVPITDPLSVQPGTTVRVSKFGYQTSTCCTGYSPIELYLMGLVEREAIPQAIYVMKNPQYVRTESAPRPNPPSPTHVPDKSIYTVDGFTKVTLDELLALNPGGPPRATQTQFRSAWILVTETAASVEMILKADWYARLAGRLIEDAPPSSQEQADAYVQKKTAAFEWSEGNYAPLSNFPVRQKYLSFAEATGNRATLDVQRTPRT